MSQNTEDTGLTIPPSIVWGPDDCRIGITVHPITSLASRAHTFYDRSPGRRTTTVELPLLTLDISE